MQLRPNLEDRKNRDDESDPGDDEVVATHTDEGDGECSDAQQPAEDGGEYDGGWNAQQVSHLVPVGTGLHLARAIVTGDHHHQHDDRTGGSGDLCGLPVICGQTDDEPGCDDR